MMEAGMLAKPDSQFFSINIFSSAWFQLWRKSSSIETPSQQKHSCCQRSSHKTVKTVSVNISEKKKKQTKLKASLKQNKREASGWGNWGRHGLWVCRSTKFCSFVPPNRMSLTDRHSSRYISVCTGMKKSMLALSYPSSISASEPSYEHRTPSTEPTQREKCTPNIDIWRVALVARKDPCNSHGKGLAKQACPPPAQARTRVSTLGTVLKGHF